MLDTNFEDRVYKKLQRVSAEVIFWLPAEYRNFWEVQRSLGAAQASRVYSFGQPDLHAGSCCGVAQTGLVQAPLLLTHQGAEQDSVV